MDDMMAPSPSDISEPPNGQVMPYVLYQVLGTRAGSWTSLAHSDNRHLFQNRRSEISKAEWKLTRHLE